MNQIENQSELITDCSLIATFFGPRGKLHILLSQLIPSLDLEVTDKNLWENPDGNIFLSKFDPRVTHDTTVIQISLNGDARGISDWATLRHRLELCITNDVLQNIWGYSLCYQGVIHQSLETSEQLNSDHPLFRQSIPYLLQLQSNTDDIAQILASSRFENGNVWLARLPLEGEGIHAASIYMALSTDTNQPAFIRSVILGPNATLLMPDLIAHKSFHQIRQYRNGNLKDSFEVAAQTLLRNTQQLLIGLRKESIRSKDLEDLANDYALFTSINSNLKTLQISLEQQIYNLQWWREHTISPEVMELQAEHIQSASQELSLIDQRSQSILQAASVAVEILRAKSSQRQERAQQQIQVLLAAIGVGVTVPAFIGHEATALIMAAIGIQAPLTGYHLWMVISAQLVLTLLVAIFVAIIVYGIKAVTGRSR